MSARTAELAATRHPLPARLVLTVLAPFSAGYFLSNMYRAINAMIAGNLRTEVGLDASALGLVSAAYLIAFALFQLPLGVLLDRYGPRRVQAALLLTAATGSLLFALGTGALSLALARALIGLGFAGGLMAGFKAVVLWFHPTRHALANASVMCIGGLGLITATVPAEFAVQTIGWRGMFIVSAVATAFISMLIFTVVPERDERPDGRPLVRQLGDIGRIYSDAFFWRLAPLVALTAGSHIAIHTLWAGPWFVDIAGFDRDGQARHLMVIAVAFLVGTFLGGVVADRLGRRGVDPLTVMLWGLVLFMLSQAAIIAEALVVNLPMWIVFGMTGQIAVLAYPTLARHFGTALSGRAQTAINLLLFAMAWAGQWFIGLIINRFPAGPAGGYHPDGYRYAFGALLALQLLALLWYGLWRAQPRPERTEP